VRQIALIYRKDKALSKAALGFIEVAMKNAALEAGRATARPVVSAVRSTGRPAGAEPKAALE